MEYRPAESLKLVAKELSSLIMSGSDDFYSMEALLMRLPQISPTGKRENIQAAAVTDPENGSIGIWKRVLNGSAVHYVRDADRHIEWPSWANVHELYPRGSKNRIVLLGESVARGYLYDPYYNVAQELAAILNASDVMPDTEVIDLAKTSLPMEGIVDLIKSSIALEPDIVVIFAGNNWAIDLMRSLTDSDHENLSKIFRKDSFLGVKSYIDNRFVELVSDFMGVVADFLVRKGVPVIFVIPEFNLKEWKSDEVERSLLWFPNDNIQRWLIARSEAGEALAVNNIKGFGAAAAEMVKLCPSNPLSHEFLGHFYLLNDEQEHARSCFEASRDVVLFSGGLIRPKCYKVVRDQIMTEAPKLGISIVDLPTIFKDEFPTEIPGRNLFLDYCHLTVEGIKLAMRYTAQSIIAINTGLSINIEDIQSSAIYPDAHTLAIAHFGAAIHNSHNGQPADIVQYHCHKSVGFSHEIADIMKKFADFSSRHTSTSFCKSFEEIILDGRMRQYEGGLSLTHAKRKKLLDIDLVDAISESLKLIGIDLAPEIERLRIKEHGIGPEGVNLLESFYSTTGYNEFRNDTQRIYFQSRSSESWFTFIKDMEECPLIFSITYRTPRRNYDNKYIEIYVNGKEDAIARMPMSGRWCNHSFTIDAESLKKGVNKIVIHWPYTTEPLLSPANNCQSSVLDIMYPVSGEIYSFAVKASRMM